MDEYWISEQCQIVYILNTNKRQPVFHFLISRGCNWISFNVLIIIINILNLLILIIRIREPMICVAFFWIDCANCWSFPMTYWEYNIQCSWNKKYAKFLIINQHSTIAHIRHKWARWLFHYNQQKHFAKCNNSFVLVDGVDCVGINIFFIIFPHFSLHGIRSMR